MKSYVKRIDDILLAIAKKDVLISYTETYTFMIYSYKTVLHVSFFVFVHFKLKEKKNLGRTTCTPFNRLFMNKIYYLFVS